jgi:hypothetical protein
VDRGALAAVIPATPMNRYDQISVHPERTPPTAPRPRPV